MIPQRFRIGLALVGVCLAAALVRCDYSAREETTTGLTPGGIYVKGSGLGPDPTEAANRATSALESPSMSAEDKGVILENVIELIRTAALKPGGDNFAIATKNLNQYFGDVPPEAFALKPEARTFLLGHMTVDAVRNLETPTFRMPDARHLEDCMLYYNVATRVGGTGDDLARVRRVFRWIMEQIQLVPAGSLAAPGLGQAFARPYDVLIRGMATETEGVWAERGWLFLVLCRQMGVDAGLLTYTAAGGKEPVIWSCVALIDGKLTLFDTRIGLEVPGPGGDGVATLDDVLGDPEVLARLDLPGQSRYGTSRAALLDSVSKIGVLLDSSPGYHAPRMALLQGSLAGKNRTILYRDPVDERDRFVEALGKHAGKLGYWELPAMVESLLFNDARFVEATKHALVLFDPNRFPLVYARIKQLRGDIPEAMQEYVAFRFAETPLMVDRKTRMPSEVQQALDIYATYFLALCHLEQGRADQAKFFFEKTLELLPEPGRGQPYYNMFRWGAQANLGRLCEARGDAPRAIAYYTQVDPTAQQHGNLVRARALVWADPAGSPAPALPPAPIPAMIPPFLAAPPQH